MKKGFFKNDFLYLKLTNVAGKFAEVSDPTVGVDFFARLVQVLLRIEVISFYHESYYPFVRRCCRNILVLEKEIGCILESTVSQQSLMLRCNIASNHKS